LQEIEIQRLKKLDTDEKKKNARERNSNWKARIRKKD
jgi:hypothetical protein